MRRRVADVVSPRIAKYVAGLAIAASVTAVAIISLQPSRNATPASQTAERQAAQAQALTADSQAAGMQNPAYPSALNAFLVEHSEFTPAAGMNGMMSYVRVVGYNSEKPVR